MPLGTQRLDHGIRHRLPTAFALCTVAMGMAVDAPCVPILLYKRRARIKRIAALGAEKVACVPFSATGDDDFAFNRRLAALAARGEEFVEIKVAVEA